MTEKHLDDLAEQIERSLKSDDVSARDRSLLEQVQSELQAPSASLRNRLTQAVDRLEGEHPRLTELLSKALDALSDVGI
jgi:hypothetical protein